MSLRFGLIVVEGPHDRAFVGRLLRALGFASFKQGKWEGRVKHLDLPEFAFWKVWKPEHPKAGSASPGWYKPIDEFPELWVKDDWSIGVLAAGGDQIFTLPERLTSAGAKGDWAEQLMTSNGFLALIVDADENSAAKWEKLTQVWTLGRDKKPAPWPWPSAPGEITHNPFRVGAFIVPDNLAVGTIDSVLVSVGQAGVLSDLVRRAKEFAHDPAFDGHYKPSKPFDRLKATVAAAVSLLKPGWPNASSIEEDAWITSWSREHEVLAPLSERLRVCAAQLEALARELEAPELAELAGQPFDRLRATVAAATSLLRPGAANAVGIEQCEWFDSTALGHPSIQPLADFMRRLLELPPPP